MEHSSKLSRIEIAIAALSILTVVAMFLGWVRTGARVRNSFEILDSAVLLDPTNSTWIPVIEAVWLFLPALAVAGPLLRFAGLRKIGIGMITIFAIAVAALAGAAANFVGLEIGNVVALTSSTVILLMTASIAFSGRRNKKIATEEKSNERTGIQPT